MISIGTLKIGDIVINNDISVFPYDKVKGKVIEYTGHGALWFPIQWYTKQGVITKHYHAGWFMPISIIAPNALDMTLVASNPLTKDDYLGYPTCNGELSHICKCGIVRTDCTYHK